MGITDLYLLRFCWGTDGEVRAAQPFAKSTKGWGGTPSRERIRKDQRQRLGHLRMTNDYCVGIGGRREPRDLPFHLGHPAQDDRAVAIHALGASLQRGGEDGGEPCRLFPSDIPGCGLVVVTTRRVCAINT